MKKVMGKNSFYKFTCIVTIVSALFASCAKEEQQFQNEVEKSSSKTGYTFAISGTEDTKTVIGKEDNKLFVQWEAGDELGYMIDDNQSPETGATVNTNESPVTFTLGEKTLAEGSMLYVFYPYIYWYNNSKTVMLTIPNSQAQDATNGFDMDNMPMIAEPITITSEMIEAYASNKSAPVADVKFANLGSLIMFKVFSDNTDYQGEKVQSVAFNAGTSYLAGTYLLDADAISFSDNKTLEIGDALEDSYLVDDPNPKCLRSNSITTTLNTATTVGESKENALDIYMVVAPGTYTGSIVVITDAATYTYQISEKTFTRSGIKAFGLNLNSENVTRTPLNSFTWDLSKDETKSASATQLEWDYRGVTMVAAKAESTTAANNYYPGVDGRTSTRFYTESTLTISPYTNSTIAYVEFTATSDNYASALANSTWTNASASASGKTVTITPTNGSSSFYATIGDTCGFTSVKVYYTGSLKEIQSYTLTFLQPTGEAANAGCSFTISVDGSTIKSGDKVESGKKVTLNATVGTGYALKSWTVTKKTSEGTITVTDNKFTMPDDDVTVSATFTKSSDKSYTITFSTGSGDGTTVSTNTQCSTIVSEGSNYLSGNVDEATKVYYGGEYGLKLGASKDGGTIKMNLASSVTPTSIVVSAKRYNSGKAATLKVNGSSTQNLTSNFANYTFSITSSISYLELVSSKYCWIASITVNY